MIKIVRASLPLTYTFTGSARNATATQDADATLTFKSVEGQNGECDFTFWSSMENGATKFSYPEFKRARLIPSGANGLLPSAGKVAGNIKLTIGTKSIDLAFDEFGTWEAKDIKIYDVDYSAQVAKIKAGSVVNIDDFNLQSSFVGQSVTFVLEIEIER